MSRRRDRTARTGGVRGSVKAAPKPIDSRRGAPLNISGAGTARGSSGGRLSPRSAAAGEAHAALSAAAATGHAHLVGRGRADVVADGALPSSPATPSTVLRAGSVHDQYEFGRVRAVLCACVPVPVCRCAW